MIRPSLAATRAAALAVAVVLPALLLAPAAPAAAATPKLTISAATTYDVLPDEGRVAVTAQLTITNRLRDTVARRFFYRTAHLAVLPGTTGFRLTGGNGTPKVSVTERAADHTVLRLDFGANLAAGKSTKLTLRFDLKDPDGAPDRPVRITPSLVTFDAWAIATPETAGSSVTVSLPEDYAVEIGRGPLDGPTPTGDGRNSWTSGRLDRPLEFVADVFADRPAEHVETSLAVPMADGREARILLRPWPDDPAWAARIGALVARALPILEREIGLPWPIEEPLALEEALVRGGTDFAGSFDPAASRIEIAYAASDGVVLHELAHAWFNGRLVADRWIAEAFAAHYADRAAVGLGIDPESPVLSETLEPAAIPLNAWGPAGADGAEVEAYGYAASLQLGREIAGRALPETLSEVWIALASRRGAYQPARGSAEPLAEAPDWRALLDLLEERTGRPFDDLWRTWVARPPDIQALDDREAARARYAATVDRAGEWSLPRAVRDAMRAWRFDVAVPALAGANRVLDRRAELEDAAAEAGLVLPPTLREAFEVDGDMDRAEAEAEALAAVIQAIREAEASRPVTAGPADEAMVTAGLVGTDPEARMDEAAEAFAAGEVDRAFDAATAAEDLWSDAWRVGRGRLVSVGLLALSLLLLIGVIRGRRRGAPPPAT